VKIVMESSTRVEYKNMLRFSKEIFETYDLFKGLKLVPIKTYEGMDTTPAWDFKAPEATGFYRAYRVEGDNKIDKICVGELHYMNRAIYNLLTIMPTGDYDLPYYYCEYNEFPEYVAITTDLMPLVDIVVYDEYRVKYLDPLESIWQSHKDLPGFTEEGRCFLQRRFGPWPWAKTTLSLYVLDGKIKLPDARRKALDASIEYAKTWLKLRGKAEPIKDPEYREEMLTRKRTLRKCYRNRDRDADSCREVTNKLFGGEQFKLFMSLMF